MRLRLSFKKNLQTRQTNRSNETLSKNRFWLSLSIICRQSVPYHRCLWIPKLAISVPEYMKLKIDIFKVPITPKYFFRLNKSLYLFETHCAFSYPFLIQILIFHRLSMLRNLAIISHTTEQVRGMGLFLVCSFSQTSLHACLQRPLSLCLL